jgi:signal transduction histidine kinase
MIQTYIKPIQLDRQVVNGLAFLRDLLTCAEPALQSHNVSLSFHPPAEQPELDLDPGQMERALLNLLKNAAYQMPPKGVLRLEAYVEDRMMVIRLVYPAGYLPDDQLRHFFYPFTTEDSDQALVDLPLTPVIVHKHGGIINVGREGDDLVAVTIELPLHEAGVQQAQSQSIMP